MIVPVDVAYPDEILQEERKPKRVLAVRRATAPVALEGDRRGAGVSG
jgi:hypothetical protein